MDTWRSDYHSRCLCEKQLRKASHCSEFTWLLSSPQMENFQGCAVRRMLYHSPDWHKRALQLQGRAYKRGNLQKQAAAQTSDSPISLPHRLMLLCRLGCSAAAPWARRAKKISVFSTECIVPSCPHVQAPLLMYRVCARIQPPNTDLPLMWPGGNSPRKACMDCNRRQHTKTTLKPWETFFFLWLSQQFTDLPKSVRLNGGLFHHHHLFPTLILFVSQA